MNRRVVLTLGVALTLLTVPAGCGIPGQTEVRVDGGSQAPGGGSIGVAGQELPRRIDSGDRPDKLVENFLRAAAGEAGSAYDRVSEFIAPASRNRLARDENVEINVVRLLKDGLSVTPNGGTSTVTVAVQQVGLLRQNGVLGPPTQTDTSYTFEVGKMVGGDTGRPAGDVRKPDDDKGLYLLNPPPVLLMSADALTGYYQQQTIYFWSKDGRGLVPDQRYLPLSVPTGRRPTEVLGWLTGGPADWLTPSVDGLPEGSKTIGNAAQTDDTLVVNLAMNLPPAAPEAQLKRLSTQLAWSLREIYPHGRLELMIRDQRRRVFEVEEQRRLNPLYPVEAGVSRYCVFAGAIHRAEPPDAMPEPPPVDPDHNRNIASAAVARIGGQVVAALVTAGGQLLVGAGPATVTQFKASGRIGHLGQPTWLRGTGAPNHVGLIVVDGRLFRFGMNAQLAPVPLQGAPEPVTAVAAALDGQRIAFIARERLYVASLTTTATGSVEVGQAKSVPTSLRQPAAVAWRDESTLVVAGQVNGHSALYDVTLDGGAPESSRVDDLGRAAVSHLVVYPYNPMRGDGPLVMFQANGAAWTEAPVLARIDANQLQGVARPPAGAVATAPFFLY